MHNDAVTAVMVNLKEGDDLLLFILLAADGTLNRMGNGADTSSHREMTIRRMREPVFARIKPSITNEMLAHAGRQYQAPDIVGSVCSLKVGFRLPSGDTAIEFIYGSQSLGPPDDLKRLVLATIDVTDPWYRASSASKQYRSGSSFWRSLLPGRKRGKSQ